MKGYGLREAIVALETAGYNVDYTGSGYVRSMEPAAGTRPARGTRVRLVLGN